MVTPEQLEETVQAYMSEMTSHQHVKGPSCTCPAAITTKFLGSARSMLTILDSLMIEVVVSRDLELTLQGALSIGFILGSRCEALEHLESLMKES